MSTATLAAATLAPSAQPAPDQPATPKPAQRLARKYAFDDPDMDLFFMAALGWGPSGGLDIGQAYYIASQITDGDADSWVSAFSGYAQGLEAQADTLKTRGRIRTAGETRLKAFAAWRSSWQFAAPGSAQFQSLYAKHQAAFAEAMRELALPATFFQVPWQGGPLPGVFLQNVRKDAPVALVIGGADTCFEDLFLTLGRNLLERGYSVALADLPGQGNTPVYSMHWPVEAEQPIAAVVDLLVERFNARPGRIALIGLSLGGYFVARAAGFDKRLATVIASTPFPSPAQLFALSVQAGMAEHKSAPHVQPTASALRSRHVSMWKMGANNPQEFVALSSGMVADPTLVTLPFLSILGGGDSPVFAAQARDWHEKIGSKRKEFVLLDAASGADGHVQVNNRLRLAQEAAGWMDEVFS
jgi:alpha-beta hydrolase superfamily lysophospholipase